MADRGSFYHCAGCELAWLDRGKLDTVVQGIERRFRPDDLEALRSECRDRQQQLSARAFDETASVRYFDCPECGERMHRRAFAEGSGIIMNLCAGHGLIMGEAELKLAIDFVERGGELLTMARRIEELDEQLAEAVGREKEAERRATKGGFPLFFPYAPMI